MQMLIRKFTPWYSTCTRWASTKPKIAVVGSGPAGMFTCSGLLRRTDVDIDVFDAAPVPFGLVRYGVAPDHQEVKNCINLFDTMFNNNSKRLQLFCNVRIGTDVSFAELKDNYDAVLLAHGSYKTRQLEIPGTDSENVISGSQFVGWYNGLPNIQTPALDTKNAVIVGNGNVALDCARILSTANSGLLRKVDIPSDRLSVLEASEINKIRVLGRRGPENVSFTIKEVREQFKVKGWDSKLEMSDADEKIMRDSLPTLDRRKKRLTEILLKNRDLVKGSKTCQFLFHRVPKKILKNSRGRVEALSVENKETGEEEVIDCGLLVYCLGYQPIVLDGVPKNANEMIDMKDQCRVNFPENERVYATGWCAHGAKGVIVDTQQQSALVADQISSDLSNFDSSERNGVKNLLLDRKVSFISWSEWKKIDDEERKLGEKQGKVREKFTSFDSFVKK